MKLQTLFTIVAATSFALATEPTPKEVAMKVHEWGTFTVLQGSNGHPIAWYQAPREIVDLPPFVHQNSMFNKSRGSSGLDLIRMETPVLYFYPEGEQPVDIHVSATFNNGRITEIFPPAYTNSPPNSTVWQGTLLPPDSPDREKVPTAKGKRGSHYAAARAVPEAWLFRGEQHPEIADRYAQMIAQSPDHPALPDDPTAEPIDHFIFYRGAGNPGGFSIQARQSSKNPSKYTLKNSKKATIPKLFALRVIDDRSSWLEITDLKQAKYSRSGMKHEQSFVFPEPIQPVADTAEDLCSAMVAALTSEGLTKDEALAMVATWDNLWFKEPGTRVLAVLPQVFADEMVPLKISPKPTTLERVFVARLELINRAQEAMLVKVLNDPSASSADLTRDAARLANVQLGRYSAGGMERARDLVSQQIYQRFYALKEADSKALEQEVASSQ